MNVIFQALGNLKHNGTQYTAGQFFEGAAEEFEHLVLDGVLRLVEGAKTVDDAAAFTDAEAAKAAADKAAAEAAKPVDTWAPAPTAPEAPAAQETPETTEPAKGEEAAAPAADSFPEVAPGEAGAGDVPPPTGDNL